VKIKPVPSRVFHLLQLDKVELKFCQFERDHCDFGHAIVMGIASQAGLASLGGNRPHFSHRSWREA
jgi:hypothetical protein